jgi:hypothetical protein
LKFVVVLFLLLLFIYLFVFIKKKRIIKVVVVLETKSFGGHACKDKMTFFSCLAHITDEMACMSRRRCKPENGANAVLK